MSRETESVAPKTRKPKFRSTVRESYRTRIVTGFAVVEGTPGNRSQRNGAIAILHRDSTIC